MAFLYVLGNLVRLYSDLYLGLTLFYFPPLFLHLSKHYFGLCMMIIVECVFAVYSRVIIFGELLYMVLFTYAYLHRAFFNTFQMSSQRMTPFKYHVISDINYKSAFPVAKVKLILWNEAGWKRVYSVHQGADFSMHVPCLRFGESQNIVLCMQLIYTLKSVKALDKAFTSCYHNLEPLPKNRLQILGKRV